MPEFRLLLYSYESFAKIAQASAMRVTIKLPSAALFSAKIAQASAMRVYSQIAERSFIFCKDKQLNRYCQTFLHLKTFSSFFPPFFTFLPFYPFTFHTNFSPLFICTSFTNFLTSADESSFLHINSTLPSSATI